MTVLSELSSGEVFTAALISPVSVGAGVLAGPVSVVKETLVDIQAVDGTTETGPALKSQSFTKFLLTMSLTSHIKVPGLLWHI